MSQENKQPTGSVFWKRKLLSQTHVEDLPRLSSRAAASLLGRQAASSRLGGSGGFACEPKSLLSLHLHAACISRLETIIGMKRPRLQLGAPGSQHLALDAQAPGLGDWKLARGPLLHTSPAALAARSGHILHGCFKVLNFKARTHGF